MDRLKLKWRVFSFLLVFVILLIGTLWFFQTVLLNDMYKYVRKQEIERAISFVEANINNTDLQDILKQLEQSNEIIVTPTQDFVAPPRQENSNPNRNDFRPQPETITQTKEFILEDNKVISLTFYAIITPVEATVSTLKLQLYIISIIMFTLSIILAVIIAKKVAKPIEKINNSAKSLAVGNYDTNFIGHGFLEIKELSNTLNSAAKELSKVDNLRKELMANISHDLRTPLALIYSYAEMMHDFPNEINDNQIQVIMDETQRLSSLVNDVFAVSQLEAGIMKLNKQRYNITRSIDDTIQRVAQLVKKDGYVLNFDYEREIHIDADEIKITQVVYNLLINAINYSNKNKVVNIVQKKENGKIRIEVIDQGEGIAAENISYIWDRYYRLTKDYKRPITGSGLGLSIVKKIIILHDGDYGVESEINKGSIFWFELSIN